MKIKVFRWTARILLIGSIMFMMMFSLDIAGMDVPFKEKVIGLFMHNIPSLLIIAILIIAWKRELVGGILLIACCLGMTIFFHSFAGNPGSLVVIAPFFIAGIMFIVTHFLARRKPAFITENR